MGLPYYYKKIRVDDGASGTKPKYELRRQYFLYPDSVRKQAFEVPSKVEKLPEKMVKKSHADCINELIAIQQTAGRLERKASRTSFPFPAKEPSGVEDTTSFQKTEENIPKTFFSKTKVSHEMPKNKASPTSPAKDVPNIAQEVVSSGRLEKKNSIFFSNFPKEAVKVAEGKAEKEPSSKSYFSKETPRKEIVAPGSLEKKSKEVSKGRSETSTTSLPLFRTREEDTSKKSLPVKEALKTSQEKPSKAFFTSKEIHQSKPEKSSPVKSAYLRKSYSPPSNQKKPTLSPRSAPTIREPPKKSLVCNNPNLRKLEAASQKETLKKLETYFKDRNSFLAPSFDSFHRDENIEERPQTVGYRGKYSTAGDQKQTNVLGKSVAFAKISSKSDTHLPSCGKKYRTGRDEAQNKVSVSVIQDTNSLPKEEYLDYVDEAARRLKDIYKSEDVLKKTRQINEIEKQYLADQEKRAFTEAKRAMEEYLRITLPKCENIQKKMKEHDGKLPPHLNPPGSQRKRKTPVKNDVDKSKMGRIVGREIGEGGQFSKLDKHRPSSPIIKSLDTKTKDDPLENVVAKEKEDELEIQADVKDDGKGDSFYIEKINIEFHLDQDKEYNLEDAKKALEDIRGEIQQRKLELERFKGENISRKIDVSEEVLGTDLERDEKNSDVMIKAAYFQIKQQVKPEEEETEEPTIAETIDQLGRTISTATTVVGKGSAAAFDSKSLSTNAYKSKTDTNLMNIEKREKSGTIRINTINVSALESKDNQITPKVYKYSDPKFKRKSKDHPPVKSFEFPRVLEEYDPLPMTIYKMDDAFEKRSSTQMFDLGREAKERLDSIYNLKKHSDDSISIKTTSETQSVASKPKSSLSSIRSLESRLDEVLTSTKNLIKRETHNDACHFKSPQKSTTKDRSEVLAKNEIREINAETMEEPHGKSSMIGNSQNLIKDMKTTKKLAKKNSIVLAQNEIKEINIEVPDDFSRALAATKSLIKRKNFPEIVQKPVKPYPAYDMTTNSRSLVKDMKRKTASPRSEARGFNTISTEEKTPKELGEALESTKDLLKRKAATKPDDHKDVKRRTGIPKLIRQKESVVLARNEVKEIVLEPPQEEKIKEPPKMAPKLKLSRSFETSQNAAEAEDKGKQYMNLLTDHSQMIQPLDVHRDGKRAFRTLSSRDIKNYFKERSKNSLNFSRNKCKTKKPKKEKDCCEVAEEEYCQEMCDRRWGKKARRLDLEALEKTTCPPSLCIKKAKEAKCRMERKKKAAAKRKAKEAAKADRKQAPCDTSQKKEKRSVCGKKSACSEKCREVMEEMKKGKKKGDSKKSKKKDKKEMSTTCVHITKKNPLVPEKVLENTTTVENIKCVPVVSKDASIASEPLTTEPSKQVSRKPVGFPPKSNQNTPIFSFKKPRTPQTPSLVNGTSEEAPVEKLKKFKFSKISLAKIHEENGKIIAKPFAKTPKTSLLQEQLKIMQNRQSRGRLHTNGPDDDCTHRSHERGKLCRERPKIEAPSEAEKEEMVHMKKQEKREKREEKLGDLQKACRKRREIPGSCQGYTARKPIRLPYKKCPKDWLCKMSRYGQGSSAKRDAFSYVCKDAAREKRRAMLAGEKGGFEERKACAKKLEVPTVPRTVLAKLQKRKEKGGDRFKIKAMKVTKHSKPMFLQIRDRMQEKKIEACKWKLNDIIGHAVDQGKSLQGCVFDYMNLCFSCWSRLGPLQEQTEVGLTRSTCRFK